MGEKKLKECTKILKFVGFDVKLFWKRTTQKKMKIKKYIYQIIHIINIHLSVERYSEKSTSKTKMYQKV